MIKRAIRLFFLFGGLSASAFSRRQAGPSIISYPALFVNRQSAQILNKNFPIFVLAKLNQWVYNEITK